MKRMKIEKEVMLKCLTGKASDLEMEQLLQGLENDEATLIEYNRIKEELEAKEISKQKATESLHNSWYRFKKEAISKRKTGKTLRLRYLRAAASVAILVSIGASLFMLLPHFKQIQQQQITAELEKPYILTPSGQKHVLNPEKLSIRYDEIIEDSVLTQQEKKKARRNPEMNELIVPRGYRMNLELEDGTLVWLNSESRLRYPIHFTGVNRRISLSGEGYFQVKHSETKPFIVETSGVEVEVMGTSFNISAFENEDYITTTLVEGSVKLHTRGNQKDIILLPNQCGTFSLVDQKIQVKNIDTELYISWISGYYTFNSESLEIVIQKLVKSYGIPICFENPGLKNYKFSGKLELKKTLTEVLEVLKLVAPLDYHADNGKITIQNKSDEPL